MTLALIDANVPVYATGAEHPLKEPCLRTLDLVVEKQSAFVTDAEVFQELLHVYMARRMWPSPGRAAYERFAFVMRDRIESVSAFDVHQAATLADEHPSLDTRGLVHAAVMQRVGATHIVSADTDFDRLPEITRLDPMNVAAWREELFEADA